MSEKIIIDADTSGAIAALDKLSGKIQETQQKFQDNISKMTVAFGALSATLLAAGTAAAQFADDITDLAAAHGLAIGDVLALGEALGQNGGKAENAGRMLQTLANNVDGANTGNLKLVASFNRLGVSMQDLGTLSSTEIRDKLFSSLAAISDPMERNAKAMDMFGKAAVGVNFAGLADDQTQARIEMEKYAPALTTAGNAFDRLGLISERTKIAFAQAFQPVFDIISRLNPEVDSLVTTFRLMGAALVVMAAGPVLAGLAALRVALVGIAVAASANPLVALAGAAAALGTYLFLGSKQADNLKKSTDTIADSTAKVNRNQNDLNAALATEQDKLTKIGAQLQANYDTVLRKYDQDLANLDLTQQQITAAAALNKAEEDGIAAKKKAQDEFNSASADYQARNKQLLADELAGIDVRIAKEKAAVEASLRGIAERSAMYKTFQNVFQNFADAEQKIFEAQARNQIDNSGYAEKIQLETKLSEIQKIRAGLIANLANLSEKDKAIAISAISAATDNVDLLQMSYKGIGAAISDNISKSDQFNRISQAGQEELFKGFDKGFGSVGIGFEALGRKQLELIEYSRSFSTGWNNAFNNYVANATNAASIAGNLFTKFTQGIEDSLVNLVKTGKLNWKEFVASMGEELLRSQIRQTLASFGTKFGVGGLFGAGAGAAGASRGDSINNPMYVTDISKATSFGTGGQAANPVEELPGIVERVGNTISEFTTSVGNFLTEMFNGIGNFISNFTGELGNIISSFGSSLYDILGSIGSTLFDVIGALGSGLGDIIGSLGSSLGDILGSIGGGGGGGGVLSTLFDIGASLFGFANGGVIPNNGPVLVGEKGPEIMFGSQGAAIVPISGGGGSNVTYNINAVDARSFKELIAADPSFIYAVTMQGAKSMPGRI